MKKELVKRKQRRGNHITGKRDIYLNMYPREMGWRMDGTRSPVETSIHALRWEIKVAGNVYQQHKLLQLEFVQKMLNATVRRLSLIYFPSKSLKCTNEMDAMKETTAGSRTRSVMAD